MIEHDLQQFFIRNQLTLSLAESCTGGGVSARLVRIPDCSRYFLGSIVSYSGKAKEVLLGVSSQTLKAHGEVSAETAQEMAQGALKQLGSDYALAITGIAGPSGGSLIKPVGTVFFAIATAKGESGTQKAFFEGEREAIIVQSTESALLYLWKYIN